MRDGGHKSQVHGWRRPDRAGKDNAALSRNPPPEDGIAEGESQVAVIDEDGIEIVQCPNSYVNYYSQPQPQHKLTTYR